VFDTTELLEPVSIVYTFAMLFIP